MSAASEDGLEDFRLDRSQFSVVRLAGGQPADVDAAAFSAR
jgi:hypothetical protein